ncbi:ribosylnicotinamide kinase [Xylographa bjoerkii]|nr:ribosylnicotinamide kinase [Xylographa bjoerkii]
MDSGIDGLFGLRVPRPRIPSRSPSRGRAQTRSASATPRSEAAIKAPARDFSKVFAASVPVRDPADSKDVSPKVTKSRAIVKPLSKLTTKTRKQVSNEKSDVPDNLLLAKEGLSPSVAYVTNPDVFEASPCEPSAVWIGISGAPASGKTTLAHLLSFIMPSSTRVAVIHQDDYQQPRHLLVPGDPADLEQDGEHDQKVDTNGFLRLCRYVNRNGVFPPTFRTQHHDVTERAAALALVDTARLDDLQALMLRSIGLESVSLVIIVEGPFLYHEPELYDALDVRLFLRASQSTARSRHLSHREHRDANVNNDLFWQSPDYFDRVVWRLYLKEYNLLFPEVTTNGVDMTGSHINLPIQVQDELDIPVDGSLRWAAAILLWDLPHALMFSRPPRLDHKSLSTRTNLRTWLDKVRDAIYHAI